MWSTSNYISMHTALTCGETLSWTHVPCWLTIANDLTIVVPQRDLVNGQLIWFCDDLQRALPAASWCIFKIRSDNKPWSTKGQEQLNLSLQPWSAVHCGVKSLWVYGCAWAHLAVNKRETLLTWHLSIFLLTIAMWLDDTENALSLCLLLACRAARSGLAVPDTEEAQGRGPAPRGSTEDWAGGLWSVRVCDENVTLLMVVRLKRLCKCLKFTTCGVIMIAWHRDTQIRWHNSKQWDKKCPLALHFTLK